MAEEERLERLANRVGRLERALEAIVYKLDRRSETELGRRELAHGGPLSHVGRSSGKRPRLAISLS